MRSQIMVERSLLGWKEVEYEVMRDSKGTCITVCNMENFDPMGVHTGDSIVIAPSQTLSDLEYHMLRTASLKIIRALGIEGGCNVQLAFNPESFDYYIIEVNPRVSRSSALASKATGYPIARVAAKIAVGKTLDEIDNQVTGTTKACFEPALDYCVVKIPRWPFDKFTTGDRSLFTQMKATGEVMAIDRSFEAAFMKAIRGLEIKQKDLRHPKFKDMDDESLRFAIKKPTDERLWAIAEGLRRGWTVDEVNKLSRVDRWFLVKMEKLIAVERRLSNLLEHSDNGEKIYEVIQAAFQIGFPSPTIESLLGITPEYKADFRRFRKGNLEKFDAAAVENLAVFREQIGTAGPGQGMEQLNRTLNDAVEALAPDEFFTKYPAVERANYVKFIAIGAISKLKIQPVFKMVDTCAGEFESRTPYFYGTFEDEDDSALFQAR
jgi:carbamoyl-phosphate synthase large subunit